MMSENRLIGHLNITNQSLSSRLNVYTMETGDGRELELCIRDSCICWRRVGDVNWEQLVPLSDISPQRGVDYWTSEDRDAMTSILSDGLVDIESTLEEELINLRHSSILGRDETNQHPISAISGLNDRLDSIAQDKYYIHIQSTASSEWYINHNLLKNPTVVVKDSAGSTIIGEIEYTDLDNLILKFNIPISGKAYLN